MKNMKKGLAYLLAAMMLMNSVSVYAEEQQSIVDQTEIVEAIEPETTAEMVDESESELVIESDFEPETELMIESESESVILAETEQEAETESVVEIETESEIQAESTFEIETESESESESETDEVEIMSVKKLTRVHGFKAISTKSGVKLSWNKVDGATKYEIYVRKYPTQKKKLLATVLASKGVYTYVDTEAAYSHYNYYNIRAARGTAKGKSSVTVKGSKIVNPGPLTGLYAVRGEGKVTLNWNKMKSVDGYKVYVRREGSKKQKLVQMITSASVTTYTDNQALAYKSNTYWVIPYKHISKGTYGKIIERATLPGKQEIHDALKTVEGTNIIANTLWAYKQNNPANTYAYASNGLQVYRSSCGQSAYLAALYALKGTRVAYMPFLNQSAQAGFFTRNAFFFSDYANLSTKGSAVQRWSENTYGVTAKQVNNTWEAVTSEVKNGNCVVFVVASPNHFQGTPTPGAGHYITVMACVNDRIFIWNPNQTPGGQGWFDRNQFEMWLRPRAARNPYALSEV